MELNKKSLDDDGYLHIDEINKILDVWGYHNDVHCKLIDYLDDVNGSLIPQDMVTTNRIALLRKLQEVNNTYMDVLSELIKNEEE